ncbi:MAG: polysaccharide deacetylase family protein, partial [Phycisphaerae bacterium]
FGAHTVTHPNLAIVDRRRAEAEIGRSARRIEAELNASVRHFAYPFGRPWNRTSDTVAIVRRAGFDCAVTTDRGVCRVGGDPYCLPRVVCDGIADGRVLATRLSDLWVCVST